LGTDTRSEESPDTEPDGGDFDTPMQPQNIVDKVAFGRRLRAQRILAGFDRATEFTTLLRSQYGVDVSDRTVYAIERGEQMPHIDFLFAATVALQVPQDYFMPAIRSDVAAKLQRGGQE